MIRKHERNGRTIKNWIVLLGQNVTCVNDKKNQQGDHGLTKSVITNMKNLAAQWG